MATDPDYGWGKRDCNPRNGSYSAWSHGGGAAGSLLACGSDYPPDANHWLIYGPFSLEGATAAELTHAWWIDSEEDLDTLGMRVSTDGNTFYGWEASGDSAGWQEFTIDFSDVPEIGSVLGEGQVWVAFVFGSDESVNWEGAYVDDVVLRAEGGPVEPPTTTPATPPTRRPPSGTPLAYLPWAGRAARPESVLKPVTSSSSGLVKTSSGYQLYIPPGAVPQTAGGSDATVQFSIETGVQLGQLPAALPADSKLVSDVAKFGPDGFQFAWPLDVGLPVSNLGATEPFRLLRYEPERRAWLRFPYAFVPTEEGGQLSVSTHDLGYTAVARSRSAGQLVGDAEIAQFGFPCPNCDGCIKFRGPRQNQLCPFGTQGRDRECNYYLVVKSVQLKYPDQSYLYGDVVGRVMRTGGQPDGSPAPETTLFMPQGKYEFCATASQWVIPGGFLPLPGKWTFSKLVSVDITEACHNDSIFYNWQGVSPFAWPQGGTWDEPPTECPGLANRHATRPVGTGEFQATLTWTNTGVRSADMDLHLYGPNNMHVYWSAKQSRDGSLELDIDHWKKEPGTFVENIYSLKQMPKGDYRLVVVLYDQGAGRGMDFNVRSIRSGRVQTAYRHLPREGQELTVEQFTVR